MPCVLNMFYNEAVKVMGKERKKKEQSADKMIITIFGGFAIVHLTCRTLKLYNKFWFFYFISIEGDRK